ncbi:MAG: gamma-glutamylcyclotransferase [bacterium]|nr:gamma-glutamylcyclotransferase [bacterium]
MIWYFAYGSNMQRETFCGRRGIVCERAVPVRVPGWRVVFDKPPLLPIGEAFANLVPDPAATAIGVAYAVSADDLAHIELTEGVAIGNYRRVTIPVEPLAAVSDGPCEAASLSSDRRDGSLRPSTRYMGLIIAGALEHGLPEPWLAFLRGVPTGAESALASATRPLLDAFMRRRDR